MLHRLDSERRHRGVGAVTQDLIDMTEELARAGVPRARQRKIAAGRARDVERFEARDLEILMQHAHRMATDYVARAGHRIGRDRNAAGERLELHNAERVGLAWEHEHI